MRESTWLILNMLLFGLGGLGIVLAAALIR
ncbi:hypothetical protein GA0115233_107654 [Streptomyces sp. DI166]|nr:hypothetical protein GA0115233_107654 [Streptomyces sp. DI166]